MQKAVPKSSPNYATKNIGTSSVLACIISRQLFSIISIKITQEKFANVFIKRHLVNFSGFRNYITLFQLTNPVFSTRVHVYTKCNLSISYNSVIVSKSINYLLPFPTKQQISS